mgnify:CR=1 FL=1
MSQRAGNRRDQKIQQATSYAIVCIEKDLPNPMPVFISHHATLEEARAAWPDHEPGMAHSFPPTQRSRAMSCDHIAKLVNGVITEFYHPAPGRPRKTEGEKSISVTISMKPETLTRLDKEAKIRHMSRGELIQSLLILLPV